MVHVHPDCDDRVVVSLVVGEFGSSHMANVLLIGGNNDDIGRMSGGVEKKEKRSIQSQKQDRKNESSQSNMSGSCP